MLDEDEIAFLEALALGEFAAGLGDSADVLVTHDGGFVVRRVLIELDVGAADAGDLHLHQGAHPAEHPASGYSRISVLLGAVRTAASTFSATEVISVVEKPVAP